MSHKQLKDLGDENNRDACEFEGKSVHAEPDILELSSLEFGSDAAND